MYSSYSNATTLIPSQTGYLLLTALDWEFYAIVGVMTAWKMAAQMATVLYFREMVKTIVLRQDPPFHKMTGGLFMYLPSPTLKDGALFV